MMSMSTNTTSAPSSQAKMAKRLPRVYWSVPARATIGAAAWADGEVAMGYEAGRGLQKTPGGQVRQGTGLTPSFRMFSA